MKRRAFIQQSIAAGVSFSMPFSPGHIDQKPVQKKISNGFFIFENGIQLQENTLVSAQQAAFLRKLGYSGMEKMGLKGLKETFQQLSANGLHLYTVYIPIDLESQQPYPKELEDVFPFLGEKGIMPWFYFPSPNNTYPPSASQHDKTVVPMLRQLADLAARHKVKLILYPHMWYWIESVEDAVRVAKQVDRPNLGITFNLCHYLAHCHTQKQDAWKKLPALIDQALPHMFAMSINGADTKPKDPDNIWQSFIQPLGKGDFDTYTFVKLFLDKGFNGPIGLQCYNIDLPVETHLQQSISTFQSYKKRYAAS